MQSPSWNWNPTDPCYMDVETQSGVNLRVVGSKAYVRHSSTRLLSAVFKHKTHRVVWIPLGRCPDNDRVASAYDNDPFTSIYIDDVLPAPVQRWVTEGCTFVAHNAEGFDAMFWRHHVPHIAPSWCDTMHLCRLAGLPAGIDAASKAIGGTGKADDKAMKLLTEAKFKAGGWVYPVGTVPLWRQLVDYNIRDVEALEYLHAYLHRCPVTELEREVLALHSRINTRGMLVDLPFARRLRDAWATSKEEAVDRISELTGGKLSADNIGSVQQVKKYIASLGFAVQSLDKRTVDQILESPDKFLDNPDSDAATTMLALLTERQQAVRSTVGKLDRLFSVVEPDDAVRDVIVYHGAHTGRFSGRDLQPHNFPRGVAFDKMGRRYRALVRGKDPLDYAKRISGKLQSKAKTPKQRRDASVAGVLSTVGRSVLRARKGHVLVIADFAAIEARMLAHLARCDTMLDIFADPSKDIYCDMAGKLFKRHVTKKDKDERHIGKQIVLGCGYSMGADKFDAGCRIYLVDLAAANTTAAECVGAYRKAYPEVPALWKAYDRAACTAVRTGRSVNAGRCEFSSQGAWLCVELPSGRTLRYRNARVEERPAPWDASQRVSQVVYDTPHGYPKALYGGLITENIDQAVSRDALCDRLVAVDRELGYPCVLHVHDEGIWEVPESKAEQATHEICALMSTPPKFLEKFPLGVEGFCSPYYTKYAPPTATHAVYLMGRKV